MEGIKVHLTGVAGETALSLPADAEEARAALRLIGAQDGGCRITACESGICVKLDETIIGADLNTANYLAARLAELSPEQTERLAALMENIPSLVSTAAQAIDYTYNTETYDLFTKVYTAEDLALHYINDSGLIEIPPEWAEGIDLKRFGKNLEKHEVGLYTTRGYLIETGLEWKTAFEAGGEVPPEYRITA